MQKTILWKLMQAHLRTFPPINKHGNGIIANIKRAVISSLMFIIGGKDTAMIIAEIVHEWEAEQNT